MSTKFAWNFEEALHDVILSHFLLESVLLLPGLHEQHLSTMEYKTPQRDFLNEAFVLFETRGQNTLDEPVLDREYPQTFPNQLGQDAALTMVRRKLSGGVPMFYWHLMCACAPLLEGRL